MTGTVAQNRSIEWDGWLYRQGDTITLPPDWFLLMRRLGFIEQ